MLAHWEVALIVTGLVFTGGNFLATSFAARDWEEAGRRSVHQVIALLIAWMLALILKNL